MNCAAREQPDAFVLLFRHAAREPAFAAYADRFLDATARSSPSTPA